MSYRWIITQNPAGNTAQLSDPVSPAPSFVADLDGEYRVQLIVNDGQADSAPDEAIITATTPNRAPTANAGPDQTVSKGTTVQLGGTVSFDPDGDPLTYSWTLVNRPAESLSTLSDPTSAVPSFVADRGGEYVLHLTVSDGALTSAAAAVVVVSVNHLPIANAGADRSVPVGTVVLLDGSASRDPDGDVLRFNWNVLARPPGSGAILTAPNSAQPSLTPDVAGTYTIQLVVNDGEVDSQPDEVVITAENPVPSLASLSPNSAVAGSGTFTLTLNGTNFVSTSFVNFGGTLLTPTLVTATQIQALIPASAIVNPGTIQVKVTNPAPGGGTSNVLPFTVIGPVITNLSPDNGPIGTPVTITGLNFDPVPTNNQVKFNGTAAVIASATTTTIQTVVPQNATTGPVTVTTPQGTATSPEPFEVTASSDFSLIVDPSSTSVVQSGFGLYVIRMAANGPDTLSASLGVTGLPAGVDAGFLPVTIAGAQESFLFITVADTALTGTFPLNVIGTAMIDGQPVSRQAAVTLMVTARPQTALSGIVLDTNEHPLRNVTLSLGPFSTTTDAGGRFFFADPPTGDQLLTVDGATADTATATYPLIWAKVTIEPGILNLLEYVIFLHEQKNYNFTDISNDAVERVATDPEIPGFEMRIPAGVRIIGWDGQPNQKVSVRQLPINRLPIRPVNPADNSGVVYMFYFGKQGGGVPDQPIPVTLPNDAGFEPGEQGELWYFDEAPDLNQAIFDWKLAGTMTASQDGLTVATDPGVGILRFCCGAIRAVRKGGGGGDGHSGGGTGGEPVFLNDGSFRFTKTDLLIPGRIPMAIRRAYNPFGVSGVFGKQMLLDYDVSIEVPGPLAAYLIIPGEARFRFSSLPDGTFVNDSHPQWNGVIIRRVGTSFELTHKDGTRWKFQFIGGFHLLTGIQDRNGNRVTLTRDSLSRLTDVRDDFGRSFTLTYLSVNQVGSVMDHLGRTVTYGYNASGKLSTVTDPVGGITQYEYDAAGRITAITDARGINYIQNYYSASGRVLRQVLADGGEYRFSYEVIGFASSTGPNCRPLPEQTYSSSYFIGGNNISSAYLEILFKIRVPACPTTESWDLFAQGFMLTGGKVLSTTVRDPNGNTTTYRFNNFGYQTDVTNALGQETRFDRLANNLVSSTTDPLGRKTAYIYDAAGNTTSITDAEGNTTRFEYEPTFNRVTQITDALGKMTTFAYDAKGNLTATTDPLGHTTTLTYNTFGQPVTVTDPLGNTTQFEYDAVGNLTATTDPLRNRTTRIYDEVSRLTALTDPLNHTTSYSYDLLNRVVGIVDPQGGVTRFGYDSNGNLMTVTDANGNTTTHTYDSMDRLAMRTDPLAHIESYQYDGNGNLSRFTDRKGQASNFTYDALNRRTQAAYADGTSTAFTYDVVGRLTQANDSISGLIQTNYDNLNRLTSEITPQGVVTYTYDAIGRRTTMSVNGLTPVTYSYDDASRLTQVAQGPQAVNLGYDV